MTTEQSIPLEVVEREIERLLSDPCAMLLQTQRIIRGMKYFEIIFR
jgi:hypothetical protein